MANVLHTPIAMARLGHRAPKQRQELLESLGIPREEKVREVLDRRANEFYLHRSEHQFLLPTQHSTIIMITMPLQL